MPRLALTTTILAALLTLPGCVFAMVAVSQGDANVSKDERYWGGFKPGETYELLADAHIDGKRLVRMRPLTPSASTVPVPAGAQMTVTRIIRRRTMEARWIVVEAEIATKPFRAQRVEIEDLGQDAPDHSYGFPTHAPDPGWLRLVSAPAGDS